MASEAPPRPSLWLRIGVVLATLIGGASTLLLLYMAPLIPFIPYGFNFDIDDISEPTLNWAGITLLAMWVALGIVLPFLITRRFWRRAFPR